MIEGLGAAWDPKTRAEAYLLQQRLMLERMQIDQERRKQNAQLSAIGTFGAQLPDQQSRDIVTNAIYSGASPDEVTKLVARYGNHQPIDRTDRDATTYNIQLWNDLHPNAPWTELYPPPLSPFLEKYGNQVKTNQTYATTRAQEQGRIDATGYDTSQQRYFPGGVSPGAPTFQMPGEQPSPTSPAVKQPVQPAQTDTTGQPQAPSSPVVTQQVNPYGSSPDVPIDQPTPGGGRLIGAPPGAVDIAKERQKNQGGMLDQAVAEGDSAQKLLPTLDRIQNLVDIVHSDTPGEQLGANARNAIQNIFGVSVDTKAKALQLAHTLVLAEMPDARAQAGITRLAQPEIVLLEKMLGDPAHMSYQTFTQTLATANAKSQVQSLQGSYAQKVRDQIADPNGQVPKFNDYDAYKTQSLARIPELTDKYITAKGAQIDPATAGGPKPLRPEQVPAPVYKAPAPETPAPETPAPPVTPVTPVTPPAAVAAPVAPPVVTAPAPPPKIYIQNPDGSFAPSNTAGRQ